MRRADGDVEFLAKCHYIGTMFVWTTIMAVAFVLLFPRDAYAWGLATHMELARTLVDTYKELLASNAPSILEHTRTFFYGCLSPDRFLAKNFQEYPKHTHNWNRAFAMLEEAPDEEHRSFAWGYLCHLAGDVVAHNSFVPAKILQRPGSNTRQHAYWEYRFEHHQSNEAWELVETAYGLPRQDVLDAYMRKYMMPSVLGFEANLKITRRVFDVLRSNPSRRLLDRMNRRSNHTMESMEVDAFMEASLHCMVDIISHGRESRVTQMDPRGGAPIQYARSVSRTVGHLRSSNRAPKANKSEKTHPAPFHSPRLPQELRESSGRSGLPQEFGGQARRDAHASRKKRRSRHNNGNKNPD